MKETIITLFECLCFALVVVFTTFLGAKATQTIFELDGTQTLVLYLSVVFLWVYFFIYGKRP